MFGVDNVGVINQRNAPAIWESSVAEFPNNNIKGRLLLATDTITLYVDLINGNGGMSNRAVIASGLIGAGNGTQISNTGTGDYSVDLGGDMNINTTITLNGKNLLIEGTDTDFLIDSNGNLSSPSNATYYLGVNVIGIGSVIPTNILVFNNPFDNHNYAVLAQQL